MTLPAGKYSCIRKGECQNVRVRVRGTTKEASRKWLEGRGQGAYADVVLSSLQGTRVSNLRREGEE